VKPRRDLVVIGAGQGGIDALVSVLASLPAPFPAAILALVHGLPAGSPAAVLRSIGERIALPIAYAEDDGQIDSSTVRLAPWGCHLLLHATGRMSMAGGPKLVRAGRPAIDLLFQSAAEACGSRVIGVVLSGPGDDGTDGLRAIKAHQGLAVVQSPADSQYPQMLESAILGDHPDFCPLLQDIGPLLVRLVAD